MRAPRTGLYLVLATIAAMVVTGVLRCAVGSWEWTIGTWAISLASSLASALVVLYVIGLATRGRTERRAFGPTVEPDDGGSARR